MTDPPRAPAAWVIAVSMGYGHQRTAHPLRDLAPEGKVLLANDYPGIPASDRAIWERTRRFYEFVSNLQRLPLVGDVAFAAFDVIQRILRFYPRRDLSKPDWNVRTMHSLIGNGWGRHLIEQLAQTKPALPIVTSFFTPAFMAEHFEYPGDIYCAICDTDVARAWVSMHPRKSRIKYFAPTERVADRLGEYGVERSRVLLTGYPLPDENTGGAPLGILKADLARRLVKLDPRGRFLDHYGAVVKEKIGPLPDTASGALTILFSIGGAGAQKEIGTAIMSSLSQRLTRGEAKLVLSAGVKVHVRDYLVRAAREAGFEPGPESAVDVLSADDTADYFDAFNRALRATDILWTKPSELSFYSALGLPIVMAPPLGSQERANLAWLERLGGGVPQDDPRYTDEWLFDLVNSGDLAEAAMQGFVEGEARGTLAIRRVVAPSAGPHLSVTEK